MNNYKEDFYKCFSTEWQIAHRQLFAHFRKNPYVSDIDDAVYSYIKNKKVFLPCYIPYIGTDYFSYEPRILCYAINQNLSPHVSWSHDWIDKWSNDRLFALDRLNYSVHCGLQIPIKPYAEGFIPLSSLIIIKEWIKKFGGSLPNKIDDVIAATNFVKFSTSSDASSSSIPNIWWKECGEKYIRHEIDVLKPQIIIAFGQKTFAEIMRILASLDNLDKRIELIYCRFPARIPSIKSRPISKDESIIWNNEIHPLKNKIRKPPLNSYHHWKIDNYPAYFIDVLNSLNIK